MSNENINKSGLVCNKWNCENYLHFNSIEQLVCTDINLEYEDMGQIETKDKSVEIEQSFSDTKVDIVQPIFYVTINNFKNNNKALHYYTSLESYSKLLFVFQPLEPAVYELEYVYTTKPMSSLDQFFFSWYKDRTKDIMK